VEGMDGKAEGRKTSRIRRGMRKGSTSGGEG
jgi:hypothetical protein